MLPADRFQINLGDNGIVQLQARNEFGQRRGGGVMFGSIELRLPLPASMRLKMYLENRAEVLQGFVSGVLNEPWPSQSAGRHVAVTGTEIRIWFGGSNESRAEVRLRVILRSEIGA